MLTALLLVVASHASVPGDEAPWEALSKSPVLVECAKVSGVPWCRSTALIQAPINDVVQSLKDMRSHAEIFQSIVRIDILDDTTIRVVLDYPSPLDDRDYVARYSHSQEGESEIFSWVPAVSALAPEEAGIVRLPRFEGNWRLEPRDGATWVRYTWQAEIAGSFPTFGYAQAWKRAGYEALKDLARTRGAKMTTP